MRAARLRIGLGIGLAVCLHALPGAASEPGRQQAERPVRIHADAEWYRSRAEFEQHWVGVLRRRPVVEGPGSRTALSYALVTADGELAVYAAGVEALLARYADRRIDVRGRLVDLSSEGFGRELWIGTLKAADPADAKR